MHSKVSSDWLLSYIKATQPVLEIFKMDGYFPDNPHITIKPTKFTLVISLISHVSDHEDPSSGS
jgi:hypothetical protein